MWLTSIWIILFSILFLNICEAKSAAPYVYGAVSCGLCSHTRPAFSDVLVGVECKNKHGNAPYQYRSELAKVGEDGSFKLQVSPHLINHEGQLQNACHIKMFNASIPKDQPCTHKYQDETSARLVASTKQGDTHVFTTHGKLEIYPSSLCSADILWPFIPLIPKFPMPKLTLPPKPLLPFPKPKFILPKPKVYFPHKPLIPFPKPKFFPPKPNVFPPKPKFFPPKPKVFPPKDKLLPPKPKFLPPKPMLPLPKPKILPLKPFFPPKSKVLPPLFPKAPFIKPFPKFPPKPYLPNFPPKTPLFKFPPTPPLP